MWCLGSGAHRTDGSRCLCQGCSRKRAQEVGLRAWTWQGRAVGFAGLLHMLRGQPVGISSSIPAVEMVTTHGNPLNPFCQCIPRRMSLASLYLPLAKQHKRGTAHAHPEISVPIS